MAGDGLDLLDAEELALLGVAELATVVRALEQRVADLERSRPRIVQVSQPVARWPADVAD